MWKFESDSIQSNGKVKLQSDWINTDKDIKILSYEKYFKGFIIDKNYMRKLQLDWSCMKFGSKPSNSVKNHHST